jgi:predicted nucleic acid-binding protein
VQTWISHPKVVTINPGPAFGDLFLRFLNQLGVGGNLTTDAQIAALTVENQAILHSCDMDFSRFEGLRWMNPIAIPANPRKPRNQR